MSAARTRPSRDVSTRVVGGTELSRFVAACVRTPTTADAQVAPLHAGSSA